MVAFQRQLSVRVNTKNPPYATFLALNASGFSVAQSISSEDGAELELNLDGVRINNDVTIARIVAQSKLSNVDLVGRDSFEYALIDEVVSRCEGYENEQLSAEEALLSFVPSKSGTLLEGRITIADLAVFSVIYKCDKLKAKFAGLFDRILSEPNFVEAHTMAGKLTVTVTSKPTAGKAQAVNNEKTKDEGKFIDLPGAEKGKVVVRFPPEASGYLHIGHAKAALLNQYYQQTYEGQLIMRFDDTNPAKENAHFEQVIIEDLKMLNIVPDRWTHSSDYFELMLEMCEKLLKEGKAFVDDTDMETMRKEREERMDSRNRNTAPEKNLALWEEMKNGTEQGLKCCVRIKIDMQSNNGAMRDPTIYRCKPEEHVRTGLKYKVYPTYDFTCPIVDSVEGVTHTLRTTEYHDRDDQYYFICDALGLRKPHIWEYARLNMTNTVMSKRKLTWFVQEGHVDGWDDPRFPTVRGVMRRGLTVEGLKQFIVAQGGSRTVVMMEWDKIWAINKKVIDPVAPRYTALDVAPQLVTVKITSNVPEEKAQVALHPKNPDVGTKDIYRSSKLLVEQVDAKEMKVGDIVTFVNWGNLKIEKIQKNGDAVTGIEASLQLENKDYKKTMKVTWIGEAATPTTIPVVTVEYDHIISKAVIPKEDDWKNYINYDSVHYTKMVGEPALKNVKKGDIIQLQRKGFFICDHEHQAISPFSSVETPLLLIYIPDGHVKETASKTQEKKLDNGIGAVAAGSALLDLYKKVEEAGNLVRTNKAKDPKGEATKQSIQQLLELKKQYKELAGVEWKPDAAPQAVAAAPAATTAAPSGDNEAATLYQQVEHQGTVVRDLKAKDAKSEETKAAIAKLLELKKTYKEKTGAEWKPGQAPAAPPAAAAAKSSDSSSTNSDAASLYKEVEHQGTVVRDLKAKDAKSEETKAAIAKLLELKKTYKEKTGAEWKPGQAPAAATSAASTESAPTGNDAEALHKQVTDFGNLVRELKAKDPKSDATKAAIASLLESKKKYKEVAGKEWAPAPAGAPVTSSAPAAPEASASNGGAQIAEDIQKQGELVRVLKGKDAKSQETKDAIEKLLLLKKQYKEVTGQDFQPAGAAPAKGKKK